MLAPDVIHNASAPGSRPVTAFAVVIKDRSSSTLPHVGVATRTHVEAGFVIWVGIYAIRFPIAESSSWGMGSSGGGAGWRSGARSRFWGGG